MVSTILPIPHFYPIHFFTTFGGKTGTVALTSDQSGQSSEKREEILKAAARLFRDRGYSATSMRDLAKEVKLKASSLYNHIDSKEDILQAICFSTANKFMTAIQRIEKQSGSYLDKVKALVNLHAEIAAIDLTSIASLNDEWRHLPEPYLSQFLYLRHDYERRFVAILQKGMEEGNIRQVDPQVLFYTILSSVRWLYDWRHKHPQTQSKALPEQITSILLEGVLKNT
jgi:AcrR family transcriptional regulator